MGLELFLKNANDNTNEQLTLIVVSHKESAWTYAPTSTFLRFFLMLFIDNNQTNM